MRFFFDESGGFLIPGDEYEHAVSVVMGIAIADNCYEGLVDDFCQFKKSLAPAECKNGEPKGSLLSISHKLEFCDLLARHQGISLTPATLDLTRLVGTNSTVLNGVISDKLMWHADQMVYPKAGEEMRLYARQFRNLSVPQALRLYSLAVAFRDAIQHAILFLSHGDFASSWNDLSYYIDRVHSRPGNREMSVFSLMILSWLTAWSRQQPITFITEIHTPTHPISKYDSDSNGVDLGKLLHERVSWVSSHKWDGIQIADIAASIVYQAAYELHDANRSCEIYGKLMRSSFFSARRGPGLFGPVGEEEEYRMPKYSTLSRAMRMYSR